MGKFSGKPSRHTVRSLVHHIDRLLEMRERMSDEMAKPEFWDEYALVTVKAARAARNAEARYGLTTKGD